MRKSARALVLVVLAVLTSTVLGVASAFMASLALGTTALIVPGTGTPNANIVTDYLKNANDRYIEPFNPVCANNGCNPTGVDYPAAFWPLFFIGNWCLGLSCDTWDVSVGTGVANLQTALTTTSGDVVLFGYSQGGAVVSNELRNIANNPVLLDRIKGVTTIGNIDNPDGGLWSRLGFLRRVPFLNITFGKSTPVDLPLDFTTIGFQYDPVVYAPVFWGNPFSLLNAAAALETVHGNYLTPNGNGPTDPIAYGYTAEELADQMDFSKHPENFRFDSHNNAYIMIPARSLPIADLVLSVTPGAVKPIVKPFIDLVAPTWKVLADLGYDWSGDPGVARPLSLLPFNPIQNWPAVGVQLVVATVQGIQAFIGDLGGLTTTIAPSTPAPITTTTVSTLAAKSVSAAKTATLATDQPSDAKTSKPTLTMVKDSDTTVQETAVEKHTISASMDETPVTKPESTADNVKSDETKADETKADETKADETKADTDTEKKSGTEKKSDTDKRDADTAKAAA